MPSLPLFVRSSHFCLRQIYRVTTPKTSARSYGSSATMSVPRKVAKVFLASPQNEGVGARVRRSIGSHNMPNFDPFLLLDEFSVRKPAGFPDHPHRGMQTVTYMLDGAVKHEDNKGHVGIIGPDDVQWMTAGRGIVHSEMPASDGLNTGVQLWVNLAAKDKMTKPQYQELLSKDIPTAKSPDDKVHVKVVAGECYGTKSSVFTATPTLYWDVHMQPNALFQESIPVEFNAFLYVLKGEVSIGPKDVEGEHGTCAIFGDGDYLSVKSGTDGARFVVIAGKPLGEPIVQHGPFVMNTRAQIRQAFEDYSAGKF